MAKTIILTVVVTVLAVVGGIFAYEEVTKPHYRPSASSPSSPPPSTPPVEEEVSPAAEETEVEPEVEEVETSAQTIRLRMPPGSASTSPVTYRNDLSAGDTVEGSVLFEGKFTSVDWSHDCCVKAFGPKANTAHKWCGKFGEAGAYHDFRFTASYDGEYRLEVVHWSSYHRDVHIEISPRGWHR